MADRGKILALSGGVGGAKLALGLARVLAPGELTIVANTADDFEHLGLYIAPDLDTVMYTLAGLSDTQRGWGLADESWRCMDADNGRDMAREIREYFIPDFSNWKDHDAFEEAFRRLLADLRATEQGADQSG